MEHGRRSRPRSVRPQRIATRCSPHAGPAFRYFEYGSDDPKQVLTELAKEVASVFPELGGADSVQWMIGRLPPVSVVR